MTEEEYFRKNYPDSCYGDKPLSPHWDFFQDGVEFGERQSEKRIEELEQEVKLWKKASENNSYKAFQLKQENTELKEQNTNLQEMLKTERSVTCKEEYLKKVTELEQENAELKETVTKMNNVITKTFSNLTKAKELLERLLITSCNSDVLNQYPNCSEVLKVRCEAEQFLKEVSE